MSADMSPFKAPGFTSIMIRDGELDTVVRVLANGNRCTSAGLRHRLEWFYRYKHVPRPEERARPSNVVRLSDYRARRECERKHGPEITAMVVAEDRARSEFFAAIVERLEDELTCALEAEGRRASSRATAKRRAKAKE